MTRGRGTASIVASPVLVGAVTTLIVLVSVFIAYNANKGLPFVPTYDLQATLPNGSNLVEGNEVRIGGFRVGVVDNLRPARGIVGGKPANIAIVDMKLDKTGRLALVYARDKGGVLAAMGTDIVFQRQTSGPRLG